MCQEVTHCPLAAVARERLASFSPALSVVELSDIKNYFDIVQHKQESLIQKSPSNPSDLREAEYVLQHQQVEKDFNNTGMINELGSVDSRHTHRAIHLGGRVTLTLPLQVGGLGDSGEGEGSRSVSYGTR